MESVDFAGKCSEQSTDGHNVSDKDETAGSEAMLTDLADKLNNMEDEMHALEEEYQKDLLGHKKLCEEGADVRAKRALRESLMEDTEVVQEARSTRLKYTVAEELQRRYGCPGAARTYSN